MSEDFKLEELLTVRETAEILNCSAAYVYVIAERRFIVTQLTF